MTALTNGSTSPVPAGERRRREPVARQLADLAAAVREHEAANRGRPLGIRSNDASLYRRLRQICGER